MNSIKLPEFTGGLEKQELELLVGSFDYEGKFFKSVLCSPLTGIARREFSKPNILNNSGKLITSVLAEILEFSHNPNMTKEDKKLTVRGMYSADRAWCIYGIRNTTTKNEIEIRQECGSCEESISIFTRPDELKYFKIDETEFKLNKEKNDYIFEYKASWGEIATFFLARGINEEEMANLGNNAADTTHALLSICCKYLNGKAFDPTVLDIWPTGKTDELFKALIDNQPGPDTIREVKCPNCKKIIEYGVDPADFLLPNARRKRFQNYGKK